MVVSATFSVVSVLGMINESRVLPFQSEYGRINCNVIPDKSQHYPTFNEHRFSLASQKKECQ